MRRRVGATVLALLALSGCGRGTLLLAPNRPPEIHLSHETELSPTGYIRHWLEWTGSDPDGNLDHYVYAVDPSHPDRVDNSWIATHDTRMLIEFAPRLAPDGSTITDPHIFAIRAVDRMGAMSERAWVAMSGHNLPPVVEIVSPRPSATSRLDVPPSFRIGWQGRDPDGVTTQAPVGYAYRLFAAGEPGFALALDRPDSLRRLYAPTFDGWTHVDGDTTEVALAGLEVGREYAFVVVAFDEAGDYDPLFSLAKNILVFRAWHAAALGPVIGLYNGFFNYTYPTGGYDPDPARLVPVTLPALVPVTISWSASSPPGIDSTATRWVLDPVDLQEETPRTNPSDLSHWSEWSTSVTSAVLGPFPGTPGEIHYFYVEARDDLGISLGGAFITVVGVAFERPLLIVDDTRLQPDMLLANGSLAPPSGPWPSAAEADTFLYARGGVPWRGYPTGTLSRPGLFAGFDFDTLGTRTGHADLDVPIAVLRHYHRVVWLTDRPGAMYEEPGTSPVNPMTSLRYMSGPGHSSTLALYAAMGGTVWLAGGGGATASLLPWSRAGLYDLNAVPGQLMYDFAGWQDGITSTAVRARLVRYTGRFRDSAAVTGPGSPYAGLVPEMRLRSTATDPLPPLRSASDFYPTVFDLEFRREFARGPWDGSLDTLFAARGGILPYTGINTAMTVRRLGPATFVFSGFAPWGFARDDGAGLVDFVLNDVWGLPRGPGP